MKRIGIFLLLGTLLFGMVQAQVTTFNFKNDDQKDWSFSITPYALLASQATDVGGEKIRQSFNDLASITNAGFQFMSTVRYKRFSVSIDGTFAELSTSEQQGPVGLKVTINQNIIDLAAGYVIYSTFDSKEEDIAKGWAIEGLIGAKNWVNNIKLDLNIDLGDLGNITETIDEPLGWWDLMIGIKTAIALSDKVMLGAKLSVGGFGIGDSSSFAHDFYYLNAFKVLKFMTVNAGFRSFRYKRSSEGLDTTVRVLGPFLGVSFFI